MKEIKYPVGSKIWRAQFETSADYVTCPDCGGTGRIRVMFHDDTIVSIECARCQTGYDPPTGRLLVHNRKPRARRSVVCGFDVNGDKITYKVDSFSGGYYSVDENELFETEEEAAAFASKKAADLDAEERQRIAQKEKDTRSWSWNASYHRQCIKRSEKDIAYHSAKLAVASVKAKEKIES